MWLLPQHRHKGAEGRFQTIFSEELVGYGELAWYDRAGSGQPSEPSEVAHERKNRYERQQLDRVAGSSTRNHPPHQPQYWLGNRYRPDGAVEISPLVTLALGRRHHAGKPAEQTEEPDRSSNRKIGPRINLLQVPLARRNRDDQTCDIEQREGNGRAPRERVAHAAIDRVRLVFGQSNDVRRRFNARQASPKTGDTSTDQHRSQPQRHPRIESPLEQVERERSRSDEEDENPYRPMIEAIVKLVPL